MTSPTTDIASLSKTASSTLNVSNSPPPNTAKEAFTTNYDAIKHTFSFLTPRLPHDDLSEDSLSIGARKELFSLALSCKAFKEPALDCLWFNLPSIVPLLALHPALEVHDGIYWFRQIDAERVDTYRRYARRVRGVCLGEEGNRPLPPISLSGWVWLGQQLEMGVPLLPSLRRIQICDLRGNSQQMALLSLIMSPSVQQVEFFGPIQIPNSFFTSLVMPLVRQGSPSLHHFSLHESTASDSEVDYLFWDLLLRNLGRLPIQGLHLQFPYSAVLPTQFLARLPGRFKHLTTLTLDVHTPSHRPSDDLLNLQTAFPELAHVHLVNRSETELCPCFPSFLVARATSITFFLTRSVDSDVDGFGPAVEVLSTIDTLKRVEIRGTKNSSSCTAHPSALRPFFRRLALEEFHVYLWGLWTQGLSRGQEVEDIVSPTLSRRRPSGRQLVSLVLPTNRSLPARVYRNGRYHQPPAIYPSLSSLLHTARHAKGLRYLTTSVDSSVVGLEGQTLKTLKDEWSGEHGAPSSLRHLKLADMRPTDSPFTPTQYQGIAQLLDAVFPNLESTTMHPTGNRVWDEHWELIEAHRKLEKSVRLYRLGRV